MRNVSSTLLGRARHEVRALPEAGLTVDTAAGSFDSRAGVLIVRMREDGAKVAVCGYVSGAGRRARVSDAASKPACAEQCGLVNCVIIGGRSYESWPKDAGEGEGKAMLGAKPAAGPLRRQQAHARRGGDGSWQIRWH